MTQRQSKRYDFQEPERDQGSIALYAWAGIAALSALTACITVLFPTSAPVQIANKPEFAVGEQLVAARKPEIIAPKEIQKPVVVATRSPLRDLKRETAELLEKYRETSKPADPLTTATAEGEVEEVNVAPLQTAQTFPGDDAMGATIGLSDSIPELAQRYAALQRRAPDLFETVQPLVELVEGSTRLEARLVAGPFSQEAELAEFCRAIKLRITIDCSAGDYSGDPLAQ